MKITKIIFVLAALHAVPALGAVQSWEECKEFVIRTEPACSRYGHYASLTECICGKNPQEFRQLSVRNYEDCVRWIKSELGMYATPENILLNCSQFRRK